MTQINEIIIIGGGKSLKQADFDVLKPLLASKCVIAINYSYKHFPCTFMTFIDHDFYVPDYARSPNYKGKYPEIWEELNKLPLIIGLKSNPELGKLQHPNTIMIPNPKPGFQLMSLTGLFALAIAEKLEPKNIFLLGFDWGFTKITKEKITEEEIHYYNDIKHRGSNYSNFYNNQNPDVYFKHFLNSKTNIYNVSPESNINTLKKIDYTQMYNLLSKESINQEEIRIQIRNIFK